MTSDATILQFGTGKFLRAFADLFVHEANATRDEPVAMVAVQSTGTERARQFQRQQGRYHVAVRGLAGGRQIDRCVDVTSVGRCLAAQHEWGEVLTVGRSESLVAIVSNTTEAGFQLDPADTPDAAPPRAFPAKLAAVLHARWQAGLPGVVILPCELLEQNALRLLRLVLDAARRWELPMEFCRWVQTECSWRDTLVDRIVSAPSADDPLAREDALLAVAEPFALWLIEGEFTVPGLSEHPAVQSVPDLGPHHLRKVRILNGAHTALVAKARPLGIETVREAVEDERVRSWLVSLLFEEVVPTLEGRTESPAQFAETVLERFANPFLEHRLADIALHHDTKLTTRLAPTCEEFQERFGRKPRLLAGILSAD